MEIRNQSQTKMMHANSGFMFWQLFVLAVTPVLQVERKKAAEAANVALVGLVWRAKKLHKRAVQLSTALRKCGMLQLLKNKATSEE